LTIHARARIASKRRLLGGPLQGRDVAELSVEPISDDESIKRSRRRLCGDYFRALIPSIIEE
jgi:hypothetical protein